MKTQGKNSWWRGVLGTGIGILTGFAVYAALFIAGWSVLERATETRPQMSPIVVWLALFFILSICLLSAYGTGRWTRVSFISSRRALMNTLLASCIGIFTGILILVTTFALGTIIGLPAFYFVLACIISFFCAFVAGHFAENCLAKLMTEDTTGTIIKPSVAFLLIAHTTPLVILLVLLWLVVPIFQEMFSSFGGKLPAPTQFLINTKDSLRGYWFLAFPSLGALLWGEVQIYLWLHRSGRKPIALIWLWGIFIFQVLLIPFTIWAMFLTYILAKTQCPI